MKKGVFLRLINLPGFILSYLLACLFSRTDQGLSDLEIEAIMDSSHILSLLFWVGVVLIFIKLH